MKKFIIYSPDHWHFKRTMYLDKDGNLEHRIGCAKRFDTKEDSEIYLIGISSERQQNRFSGIFTITEIIIL